MLYRISILTIISFLSLLVVPAAGFAWDPPSADPPAGNTYKPINQGDNMQVKDGTLWLGGDNYTLNSGDWSFLVEKGRVGIGTTDPSALLDLSNTDSGQTLFKADSYEGNEIMRITDEGRVGIGSSTPGYKFTVGGYGHFSQPTVVGTPTNDTHATTKSYVDSTLSTEISSSTFWTLTGTDLHPTDSAYRVGIGTSTPKTTLYVEGTDAIRIPAGTSDQRPDGGNAEVGEIRYNTSISGFEGYDGNVWSGLGGVIDTDRDTRIYAEMDPDEDMLRFFTDGQQRAFIGNTGNMGIGTTTADHKLTVQGDAFFGQPVAVGTPISDTHATTKSYVDTEIGSATSTGLWSMSGDDIYNDNTGNIGFGTSSPSKKLDIVGDGINLEETTSDQEGIIYKEGDRFLHDFNYGDNGTTVTAGRNTFVGRGSGNFTMGSTATDSYESSYNTGVGYQALSSNTTGDSNTAIGYQSLYANNAGYQNTAVGLYSGRYIADGTTDNETSNRSVFLGYDTKALDSGQTNQIVIGAGAVGLGSNSVVLGSDSITTTALRGNVGIGTTSPDYKLQVTGYGHFSQPVTVGTPTGDTHAATKSYVDSELFEATSTYNHWLENENGDIYNTNTGNIGIGTSSPATSLYIDDTDAIRIPVGSTAQRPSSVTGMLRYNNEVSRFEGYNGNNWSGLGGVIDADQDTYIEPETTSGSDEDALFFYTEGSEEMRLTPNGRLGIGTTSPDYTLDVVGGGSFDNPVFVGTPTNDTHATTKSYVDSSLQSATTTVEDTYVNESGDIMTGDLNMSDSNIQVSDGYGMGTSGNPATLALSDDRVGIGTTEPDSLLHIDGTSGSPSTANSLMTLRDNNSNIGFQMGAESGRGWIRSADIGSAFQEYGILSLSEDYVSLGDGADPDKLYLDTINGNVGIGTTSPAYALQTMGYGHFSQPVTVGTPTNNSHATTKSYVDSELQSATTTLEDTYVNESGDTMTGDLNMSDSNIQVSDGYGIGTSGNPSTLALSDDRVGIGTTSPDYKLQVTGYGNFSQPVTVGTPTGDTHATTKSYVDSELSQATSTIKWSLNGDDIYNINSGNVGIGTSSPARKLQVTSNNDQFRIGYDADNYLDFSVASDGDTSIRPANSSDNLTIEQLNNLAVMGGNVGIGTTSPSYALQTMGYGHFSQPVTVGTPLNDTHATTKSYVDSELSQATSTIQWAASGDDIYNVNSGNVGIGTTTPQAKLEIVNGKSQIVNSGGDQLTLGYDSGTAADFQVNSDGDLSIYDSRFTIDGPTGNVGIGTSTPGANLHSLSADTTQLRLSYDSSNYQDFDIQSDGDMHISRNDNAATLALTNGRVGIGTTSPSYKLQVAGYGNFSQPVTVGTPTNDGHAATKNYVDSNAGSGLWSSNDSDIYYDAGNVSIGTTSTSTILTVDGNITADYPTADDHVATKNYVDEISGIGEVEDRYVNEDGDTMQGDLDMNAYNLYLNGGYLSGDGDDEGIYVDNSGNVGINVSSPQNELHTTGRVHIGGDNDSGYAGEQSDIDLAIDDSDTGFDVSQDGELGIWNNYSESVRIDHQGNVGIGITDPANELDVSGDASVSGRLGLGTTTPASMLQLGGAVNSTSQDWSDTAYPQMMISGVDNESEVEALRIQDEDQNEYLSITSTGVGNDDSGEMHVAGKVGIANTSPSYGLDVSGYGYFSQPVTVGTPINDTHAVTKNYVDTNLAAATSTYGQWEANGDDIYNTNVGNIGIGTTTPADRLQINANADSSQGARIINANSSGWADYIAENSSGDQVKFGIGGTMAADLADTAYIHTSQVTDLSLGTNDTSRLTVTGGGNVGIGTASPSVDFSVAGYGDFSQPVTVGTPINDGHATTKSYVDSEVAQATGTIQWKINGDDIYNVNSGNVGVGTTSPSTKFSVDGYGKFSQPISIGTPVNDTHAATKSYVDSNVVNIASSTFVEQTGDTMSGPLDMGGNNITGVNKLTVTTIDPLYDIGGKKYSTYAPSISGGVKEEYTGSAEIEKENGDGNYEYILDFRRLPEGGDRWLWFRTVDFTEENVQVVATPKGGFADIYYEIEESRIIFTSDKPTEFTYRLTGNRFDHEEWPTKQGNTKEKGIKIKN